LRIASAPAAPGQVLGVVAAEIEGVRGGHGEGAGGWRRGAVRGGKSSVGGLVRRRKRHHVRRFSTRVGEPKPRRAPLGRDGRGLLGALGRAGRASGLADWTLNRRAKEFVGIEVCVTIA
jgi:hypothetical protein